MRGATGGRGSNPLVWLVFIQRPSFNTQHYGQQRFKPFGLSDGVYLVSCFSGSAQVQTLWVYDRFGSLSTWVQILGLEWTCFEGFLLRAQALSRV